METHRHKRSFAYNTLSSNSGHTCTHPPALTQCSLPGRTENRRTQREREQTGINGKEEKIKEEEEEWAEEEEVGSFLLFSGCVNKGLVKLSGPQPRVFTALVSITNKIKHRPTATIATTSQLNSPCCPFPLELPGFIGNSKLRNHPSGCDHQLRRETVSMH